MKPEVVKKTQVRTDVTSCTNCGHVDHIGVCGQYVPKKGNCKCSQGSPQVTPFTARNNYFTGR